VWVIKGQGQCVPPPRHTGRYGSNSGKPSALVNSGLIPREKHQRSRWRELRALAYAHGQRVLHRDIKPSNLLLDARGTIWVTDFGLAKEEGGDLTRTGEVMGTLRYMAPERFNSISDARSLGLTLYELLALRPAFSDDARRSDDLRRIGGIPQGEVGVEYAVCLRPFRPIPENGSILGVPLDSLPPHLRAALCGTARSIGACGEHRTACSI
jgi:serine/threonine protein kinase